MKKLKYLLFTLLLCFLTSNVSAATILSVKYENGTLIVSGTGSASAQVGIFNSNKDVVYFGTVAVIDGNYTFTSPKLSNLSSGTYDIKAADYEGTNSVSKQLIIKSRNIFIKDSDNGSVVIDTIPENAISNKKITITSKPKDGYVLKSVDVFYYTYLDGTTIEDDKTDIENVKKYVTDATKVTIDVTDNSFVLPDSNINYNVVITPTFEKDETSNPKTIDNVFLYLGTGVGSIVALVCLGFYLKKAK